MGIIVLTVQILHIEGFAELDCLRVGLCLLFIHHIVTPIILISEQIAVVVKHEIFIYFQIKTNVILYL